jgi:uncharacterized membrane protein YhhN
VWLAALCAGLWAVGALLQGRLTVLEVLLVEAGALATATAVQGPVELHHLFKPLAMLLAIAFVLRRAIASPRSRALLLAALAGSLAGDVVLMFEAWFVPGLACFLLVHLCYLALLRQDVGWFPSRGALAATLTVGALMYAFLFPRLDPVLKVAVAGYIVAIALMAAQAIGRAVVLRDRGATGVAAGALLFMVSDSLLAIHLFATPLPLAQFWVLGLYYAAQLLIARNAAAARRDAAVQPENNSPTLLGGTTPRVAMRPRGVRCR